MSPPFALRRQKVERRRRGLGRQGGRGRPEHTPATPCWPEDGISVYPRRPGPDSPFAPSRHGEDSGSDRACGLAGLLSARPGARRRRVAVGRDGHYPAPADRGADPRVDPDRLPGARYGTRPSSWPGRRQPDRRDGAEAGAAGRVGRRVRLQCVHRAVGRAAAPRVRVLPLGAAPCTTTAAGRRRQPDGRDRRRAAVPRPGAPAAPAAAPRARLRPAAPLLALLRPRGGTSLLRAAAPGQRRAPGRREAAAVAALEALPAARIGAPGGRGRARSRALPLVRPARLRAPRLRLQQLLVRQAAALLQLQLQRGARPAALLRPVVPVSEQQPQHGRDRESLQPAEWSRPAHRQPGASEKLIEIEQHDDRIPPEFIRRR